MLRKLAVTPVARLVFPPFPSHRASFGLLMMRVFFGIGIAMHGYGKLGGVEGFAQYVGVPVFMGWIAVLTELVGGILLAVGALTPLISFMLTTNMVVAALHHIRNGDPFLVGSHPEVPGAYTVGWEFAALYLFAFFAILMAGPGRYAVDYLTFGRYMGRHQG